MKKISDCLVLIVDDTELNVRILVEALGDDYELAVAMDGDMALELLEETIPDIVLLDIMMPNISGLEVCEKMKQNPATQDIPVIFLSAMTDIDSKSKGFELGAVDFVEKPFDIREVKVRVKTHLSLAIAKAELAQQNEILNQKVAERTKEIKLIQDVTLETLAGLAESRDPDTGRHIARTSTYVKMLAEKLMDHPMYEGVLTPEKVYSFYESAPLHDIGKVGIPDAILLKPGRLTDEEREEMKNHTYIGYKTLKRHINKLGAYSFFTNAMDFALYHHEKWDGSGYPQGLKGEDIPLAGRLMALADVYDALVSKRVYKPSFPHSKAVRIIEEDSGTHFDPELVEVFKSIHEEIRAFAIENADFDEERESLRL